MTFPDACRSRTVVKPRTTPAPTSSPRPNITFHTYKCPEAYATWYCLNGATCFAVKIGMEVLYNCEWVETWEVFVYFERLKCETLFCSTDVQTDSSDQGAITRTSTDHICVSFDLQTGTLIICYWKFSSSLKQPPDLVWCLKLQALQVERSLQCFSHASSASSCTSKTTTRSASLKSKARRWITTTISSSSIDARRFKSPISSR